MLESLISSQTRIKLLLKFFLNSDTKAYLRGLESEFGESSNGIRVELNRLEVAGMLVSESKGKKKYFKANTSHPLFYELQALVHKHLGLDQIVEQVVKRLGNLEQVYLTGAFARGLDNQVVDMVFVGEVDVQFLSELVARAEGLVRRAIRYQVLTPDGFHLAQLCDEAGNPPFLLWFSEEKKYQHV